jgi:hypothetical protein
MTERLQERARRMRERALVRSWRYRQRDDAQGVWFRLRRVLVDAAEAWAIDDADADMFEDAGHEPMKVGRELEPAKRLFFLTLSELEAAPSRRRIPLRLGSELLEASNLALVPHTAKPEPG